MKALQKLTVLSLAFCALGFAREFPAGELGNVIKLGEELLSNTATHELTKEFVGNSLNCTSCHLKGEDGLAGTSDRVGSFIGTAAAFPAYSAREKSVQTLQDRAANCFMRSMNGIRPPIDSKPMIAITSYITWLSEGISIKMDAKRPVNAKFSEFWASQQKKFAAIAKTATHENYLRGKELYAQKCAACHGENGEGVGEFSPLWGKRDGKWLSYNAGAGLSKLNRGVVWVKQNMPFGEEGSLSDNEAFDIMLYINAQPRASFDLSKRLLPEQKAGVYNSNVKSEYHSVRSNFEAFGLDVDKIRADRVISDK